MGKKKRRMHVVVLLALRETPTACNENGQPCTVISVAVDLDRTRPMRSRPFERFR
ncbi:MAG: hypothetical protein Q8S42_26130 [Archangium sp.]|nr:hypothetical protein [Archangium sp.]